MINPMITIIRSTTVEDIQFNVVTVLHNGNMSVYVQEYRLLPNGNTSMIDDSLFSSESSAISYFDSAVIKYRKLMKKGEMTNKQYDNLQSRLDKAIEKNNLDFMRYETTAKAIDTIKIDQNCSWVATFTAKNGDKYRLAIVYGKMVNLYNNKQCTIPKWCEFLVDMGA